MSTPLGQLLLLEVANAKWNSALEGLLHRSEPAGVFLKSLATMPATWEVARKCAGVLGSVPLLAIQDEGKGTLCGLVDPLLTGRLASLDGEAVERLGDMIGRAMQLAGLNLNFAPTVDLPGNVSGAGRNTADSINPGSAPLEVAHRAEAFVRGVTRHRVLTCASHFPGLSIAEDERLPASPVVGKSMATLWREDLVPYRTLGNKFSAIQISHAAYKAYDYEFPRPASLSPHVAEGLLRLKLGYKGLAIADVSASARSAGIEFADAALRALGAGCDLLVVPAEEKPLEAIMGTLERASDFGKVPRDRVEQALTRVKNAKQGLTIPRREPPEREVSRLAHDFESFRKQYGHVG